MGKNKPVLEWKFAHVTTANATPVNKRIALGLRDDEVAEVHKIISHIAPDEMPAGGVDDVLVLMQAFSVDPNVIVNPLDGDNQADLEWFLTHRHETQIELTTEGAWFAKLEDTQDVNFRPPVLVGTDIGMVVVGDAALAVQFWVRVYFTRRKATVAELNAILLKRR
jgi:hypothetical protein